MPADDTASLERVRYSSRTGERVQYAPGKHPNSLANLRPFTKGHNGDHSHNGYSITSRTKDKLPEICPFDAQQRPWTEVLPEAFLRQALNRTDGMRELLDRVEGKVPEKHAVLGDITIKVIYEERRKLENDND